MITVEEYDEILSGYSITDCAIRTKDIFVFVGTEILSDEEIEEYEREGYSLSSRDRVIATFLRQGGDEDDPDRHWYGEDLEAWFTCTIGATNKPKSHSITIAREDMDDRVFVTGSGPAFEDKTIPKKIHGGFVRGGVTKLKTIDGSLYACGGNRTAGKFITKGHWASIIDTLPELDTGDMIRDILEAGFNDIDGFSETDIYAAGGHGDVWNFNGTEWKPIPFPSNQTLESLCCGGDSNVYISGYQGLTYMGRGDNWKKINDGGINLGWRDMVWHGDRVWCTNDYGVWTIHNSKVQRADLPPEISTCAGHLYVNDGVMLLAGSNGAAFCEDGKWTLLFNTSTMDKLLEISQHES